MRFYHFSGFWLDLAHCLGVFIHWLVVGLIIDLANLDDWHKGASLYLAITTLSAASSLHSRSI